MNFTAVGFVMFHSPEGKVTRGRCPTYPRPEFSWHKPTGLTRSTWTRRCGWCTLSLQDSHHKSVEILQFLTIANALSLKSLIHLTSMRLQRSSFDDAEATTPQIYEAHATWQIPSSALEHWHRAQLFRQNVPPAGQWEALKSNAISTMPKWPTGTSWNTQNNDSDSWWHILQKQTFDTQTTWECWGHRFRNNEPCIWNKHARKQCFFDNKSSESSK